MNKLEIEYVETNEIRPYINNAKIHTPEQIEQIKKSIQEFGFNDPLAVWHGEVIEGHGRLIAALELGIEVIPIIRLDNLTDEQRKAYTLVHNKLTMNTDFDIDLLNLELSDIAEIDMTAYGFEYEEDVESPESVYEKERTIQRMELKAFEHYDYVVFVFKNQMDWLKCVNEFGIGKVDAGYGKTKKVGVGRVIDGKRLLEKI